MSLHLTDFGTFDEVQDVSYFTFAISKFETIGENKISRAFRHAGHIWKLQLRKVNGYFGMFIRWYGTKIGSESHLKCLCKTGLEFTVINHFDKSKTTHEGSLLEDDVYDRVGSGIGYGEIIELRYLKNIPGYLIGDTLVVQVRLKIKSTTFLDKIQATTRPDRTFVRGLRFPFHGAEWSLILFPDGEYDPDDKDDENENRPKIDKATLYLSRDSVNKDSDQLRHHALFSLFVDGGPKFQIEQNFHDKQSLVFGTGYLMAADELRQLGRSGVVRVGVTFDKIQPYFNFAYELQEGKTDGIKLMDQREIPWWFHIDTAAELDSNLSCSLTIDPESTCKQIKALQTRDKKLKTIWHVKIINFQDTGMSIDVWSEQDVKSEDGVFKNAGEKHCIALPIKKTEATNEDSPYLDDDGQSCVQISLLNSNFIHDMNELGMKIEEVAAIANYHKDNAHVKEEDFQIREEIWKMSLENLEEQRNDAINNSREELEKKGVELQDKDVMINSLQEKLTSVENYVQSLESNSVEDIDKFNKTSINRLIENSKPDPEVLQKSDYLFHWLQDVFKKSSSDVVAVVPSGAYGENTLTKSKTELDVVLFLKGKLEDSLRNGDMIDNMHFIRGALEQESNLGVNDDGDDDDGNDHEIIEFSETPISLGCKIDSIYVVFYPTKNWMVDGYQAIYEASTGLTKESLGCFVTATSERRAQFIRKQDEQCRDLIRIVKHWRDGVEWERPENRPSSYLIALLVIHAYHMLKGMSIAKTPSFLKEVLVEVGIIAQDNEVRIEWKEYYDPKEFPMDETKLPLIRDPALPSHNLAETGIEDWAQFREEISNWIISLCP